MSSSAVSMRLREKASCEREPNLSPSHPLPTQSNPSNDHDDVLTCATHPTSRQRSSCLITCAGLQGCSTISTLCIPSLTSTVPRLHLPTPRSHPLSRHTHTAWINDSLTTRPLNIARACTIQAPHAWFPTCTCACAHWVRTKHPLGTRFTVSSRFSQYVPRRLSKRERHTAYRRNLGACHSSWREHCLSSAFDQAGFQQRSMTETEL